MQRKILSDRMPGEIATALLPPSASVAPGTTDAHVRGKRLQLLAIAERAAAPWRDANAQIFSIESTELAKQRQCEFRDVSSSCE